ARRISHTPEDSIGAYLAWNGEVIGLAWSDRVGGQRDIFTQQFSAEGRPVTPVYRVASSSEHAGVPAIRARDDGFLIAWNHYVLRGDRAHLDVASSPARVAQVPVSRWPPGALHSPRADLASAKPGGAGRRVRQATASRPGSAPASPARRAPAAGS